MSLLSHSEYGLLIEIMDRQVDKRPSTYVLILGRKTLKKSPISAEHK